jgi:hypothetical protein
VAAARDEALIGLLIISPLGRSPGGHFNPAVTVTLWLLRGLPGRDVIGYVAAQLAGSLVGVLLGRALLGPVVAGPAVRYAAIQPAAGCGIEAGHGSEPGSGAAPFPCRWGWPREVPGSQPKAVNEISYLAAGSLRECRPAPGQHGPGPPG